MTPQDIEAIEVIDEVIEARSDSAQTDTSRSEQDPPKKKKKILPFIIAGIVGLYVILGIAAIIFQEPAPDLPASVLVEQYAAEIVGAHNELLSVRLEGAIEPGQKLGSVKKTYATSELNKRIKIMQTNAELLADLEPDEGEDPFPDEIGQFASYILDEWVPFWEDVSGRIKEVSTTDEALQQWEELRETVANSDQGANMEQAFRSLARTGEQLGWEKESYTARIR